MANLSSRTIWDSTTHVFRRKVIQKGKGIRLPYYFPISNHGFPLIFCYGAILDQLKSQVEITLN